MITVMGISEYIVAMTARLIRLKEAKSGTQMPSKMFMRDMLSIAIVEMHSTMELTYMQKISFMKIH